MKKEEEASGNDLMADYKPYKFPVEFKKKTYEFEIKAIDWPSLQKIRDKCLVVNQAAKSAGFNETMFDTEVLKFGVIKYPPVEVPKDEFLRKLHSFIKDTLIAEIMKYERESAELKKNLSQKSEEEGSEKS